MTEAENHDVEDESSTAAVEPEAEENVQAESPPKESPEAINWKETRLALKEQQRLIKDLKAQLDHRQQAPAPIKEEIDDLSSLAKDDLLTRGQAERLAELKARQIIEETFKKQHADTAEDRIKLKYPDFDDVMSEQNIEYLRKNKPSLVRSVLSNPDPYAQAEAAYELAMAFCPQSDEAKENMKKIAENQAKPISSNSVKKSASALDQAQGYAKDKVLTKEGRSFYYEQMQEARKQAR